MPPRERMTADDIEQAGRMLMPAFIKAAREANDELFKDRLKPELDMFRVTVEKHDRRISNLEKRHWKQVGAWATICTAAVVFWEAIKARWLRL